MNEVFIDKIFVWSMYLAVLCLFLYLPRLNAWFGAWTPQKKLKNDRKNRIAVIIPARNEGKIIEDIMKSLMNQTYPRELFDIHVVVKEETDITLQKIEKYQGIGHVATHQTCKGDALDVCLRDLLAKGQKKYDAFFIVDADCYLAPDCLEQMNDALASGAEVLQAKKIVKNYLSNHSKANSMASACNGLIWSLIDDMGNRYKTDHGITNMTIGTGLMLTYNFVRRMGGWKYRQTLTEDMELMNDCAVNGYSTFYYSYAKVYVEESTSLKVTNIRRTRWLTGLIDAKMIYARDLHRVAWDPSKRKDAYFALALWPAFYFIGILVAQVIVQAGFTLNYLAKGDMMFVRSLEYSVISLGVIYLAFFIMTTFCIVVDYENIRLNWWKKILLLFIHPIFYMGYIPIILKAFLKRNTESWETIERVDFEGEEAKNENITKEHFQI